MSLVQRTSIVEAGSILVLSTQGSGSLNREQGIGQRWCRSAAWTCMNCLLPVHDTDVHITYPNMRNQRKVRVIPERPIWPTYGAIRMTSPGGEMRAWQSNSQETLARRGWDFHQRLTRLLQPSLTRHCGCADERPSPAFCDRTCLSRVEQRRWRPRQTIFANIRMRT